MVPARQTPHAGDQPSRADRGDRQQRVGQRPSIDQQALTGQRQTFAFASSTRAASSDLPKKCSWIGAQMDPLRVCNHYSIGRCP